VSGIDAAIANARTFTAEVIDRLRRSTQREQKAEVA
jgi:hypothetical protein